MVKWTRSCISDHYGNFLLPPDCSRHEKLLFDSDSVQLKKLLTEKATHPIIDAN